MLAYQGQECDSRVTEWQSLTRGWEGTQRSCLAFYISILCQSLLPFLHSTVTEQTATLGITEQGGWTDRGDKLNPEGADILGNKMEQWTGKRGRQSAG